MRSRSDHQVNWAARLWLLIGMSVCSGCITTTYKAVPVQHIPPHLLAPPRAPLVPIDFTLLQQTQQEKYFVGAGDTLGIYIENVLGPEDGPGPIITPDFTNSRYPGQVVTPKVGHPVGVDDEGKIQLPFIEPLQVSGLSIQQVHNLIRATYTGKGILQQGKEFITVNLIKPRFYRVTVIREDAATVAPALITREAQVLANRGTAQVLEMPAYENDVLHALSATGGLPGEDAHNHVWVLRGQRGVSQTALVEQLRSGSTPDVLPEAMRPRQLVKIPLRMCPGEPAPFTTQDIILHDGDIVFLESREQEFFYVGGLLQGGRLPLPRDYDLDVLGAVAIANGNVGGPAGANAAATNFRSGPGNIIPPTRVIITRSMPQGKQIKMYVNLKKALHDPKERVLIQPGDVVMLQYTPNELFTNVALNFVNVNYQIPN